MPRKRRTTVVDGKPRFIRRNPRAAGNAAPKRAFVSHAGSSSLLTASLDLRTSIGKQYKERLAELKAHLNNDVTPPQARLIDNAVRLSLLCDMSWATLVRAQDGPIADGKTHPAVDVFLRSVKQIRRC